MKKIILFLCFLCLLSCGNKENSSEQIQTVKVSNINCKTLLLEEMEEFEFGIEGQLKDSLEENNIYKLGHLSGIMKLQDYNISIIGTRIYKGKEISLYRIKTKKGVQVGYDSTYLVENENGITTLEFKDWFIQFEKGKITSSEEIISHYHEERLHFLPEEQVKTYCIGGVCTPIN